MQVEGPPADVLVVGAGPTGLALALVLARRGVHVRVVDHKHAPTTHVKALCLAPATLRALDDLGVDLGEVQPLRAIAVGGEVVPTHGDDPVHPHTVVAGQDRLERALTDALERAGVQVEYGERLLELEQRASGVTVTLGRKDGARRVVDATWLVGADGARSAARRLAGLDFPVEPAAAVAHQLDVDLGRRHSPERDRVRALPLGTALAVVVPIGDLHHVVLVEPGPAQTPTAEDLQDRLRTAAEDPGLEVGEIAFARTHAFGRGVAPAARTERVVFVGDATGELVPITGWGADAAIADAVAVAAPLAEAVHGDTARLDAVLPERAAERSRLAAQQHAALEALLAGRATLVDVLDLLQYRELLPALDGTSDQAVDER